VVVIGSRGRIEIEPRAAMGKDLAVLGMSLYTGRIDAAAAAREFP